MQHGYDTLQPRQSPRSSEHTASIAELPEDHFPCLLGLGRPGKLHVSNWASLRWLRDNVSRMERRNDHAISDRSFPDSLVCTSPGLTFTEPPVVILALLHGLAVAKEGRATILHDYCRMGPKTIPLTRKWKRLPWIPAFVSMGWRSGYGVLRMLVVLAVMCNGLGP